MIMPCMNSMSACEGCGTTAEVEGGSFRLGAPGAPAALCSVLSVAHDLRAMHSTEKTGQRFPGFQEYKACDCDLQG